MTIKLARDLSLVMKNICLIFLLILTSGCASKLKKPYLWSVEKEGRTSYIFGTIHSGVSYDEIPDSVRDKAKTASAFFNEIPIDAVKSTEDLQKMPEDFRNFVKIMVSRADSEPTLDKILSPAGWNFLVSKYKTFSEEQLKEFTPFLALNLIQSDPDYAVYVTRYQAYDYQWYNSIDYQLEKEARKHSVPAQSLDSFALLKQTRPLLIETARAVLEDYVSGRKKVNEGVTAPDEVAKEYRVGSQESIERAMSIFSKDEYEALIGIRNRDWLRTLVYQERVFNGGIFAAVGVGHMTGKDSLVELLRKAGYAVNRVP